MRAFFRYLLALAALLVLPSALQVIVPVTPSTVMVGITAARSAPEVLPLAASTAALTAYTAS